MKRFITSMVWLVLFLPVSLFAQRVNSGYDSLLAKRLGADEYGMKSYVMAFLKRGPSVPVDSAKRADIQRAHLRNISRLVDLGKLIVAGPFLDDQDIRGIFIFNVRTVEEAKELTLTDPAVQAGVLSMDLHPWYGTAALTETPALHNRLRKKNIAD